MTEQHNKGEMIVDLLKALKTIDPDDKKSRDTIASYLYTPDRRLSEYLQRLKKYVELKKPSERQRREAGDLLEQITALAFLGLDGIGSIKSFRSAGPQYDLLVTGDSFHWSALCELLYMKLNQRDIVIEAKCTKKSVSDQQFARLCSLMNINLFDTVGLGVFFTLKGAAGFPKRGKEPRQETLRDAKLRQALFHARTGKAVIVLDMHDIFELDKPASLIKIFISKIREMEYLSGRLDEICDEPKIDVPKHLEFLLKDFPTA